MCVGYYPNKYPLLSVMELPFVLPVPLEERSKVEMAVMNHPDIAAELAKRWNMRFLGPSFLPAYEFMGNKRIETVEDMKGVKFRSYNNATSRLAELTGMLPVTIEAAELSQAFATGVAESMISSGATGYDQKVWESLTHFYEVDAWLPRNYIMINNDVWNDVSEENKAIITTCASDAETRGLQASKDYTQFTYDGLREGGMTVEPASEELMSGLRDIGGTMTSEWLENAGEDGQAIVDSYKSMQ